MYTAGSGLVAAVNAVLEAPGGVPSGFDEKKLNAADENGWTALHVACTAPQRGTDKKNADPQSRCDETDGECGHSHSHGGPDSTDGDAPGAGPDSAAVVALLLAKGADPRIQNAEGDGALSVAAIHGNVDAIAALLALPFVIKTHATQKRKDQLEARLLAASAPTDGAVRRCWPLRAVRAAPWRWRRRKTRGW